MKIAYVSRPYHYCDLLIERLRKEFEVERFNIYGGIKEPNDFDVLFVEHIGKESLEASQVKHKDLMIYTRGVGVYEASLNRINWDNVNWLLALSEHQMDYFKRRWGQTCKPKHLGVLPIIAPLDKFTLKKNKEVTNKVALIANITDRKGCYQIPEFLEMFPNLEIHHLGKVCLYGNPVAEFIRWRLERDGNTSRYHYTKHVDFNNLDSWLEDKTYIWLPSISEGFNRSVLEGMSKGLKPIVRHFAGAEKIWSEESLYDTMEEIADIINLPHRPEQCRDFVKERYGADRVFEIFKQFIK